MSAEDIAAGDYDEPLSDVLDNDRRTAQIAAALSAFQGAMQAVAKGKTAKVQSKTGASYEYSYAGLAEIFSAAAPELAKQGLAFSCIPTRIDSNRYVLRGLLLHTSGQKLEAELPLMVGDPQATGSQLTYMRRYLFGCLTGVVTEEDDDGAKAQQHYERTQQREREQRQAPARRQQQAPPKPASPVPGGGGITDDQQAKMFVGFESIGIGGDSHRKEQLALINDVIGGEGVTSRKAIDPTQADQVLDRIRAVWREQHAPVEPADEGASAQTP